MTIRIWQSFSCNNSSSYRLVARFADAAAARDTALELAAFFKTHAKELDDVLETTGQFPSTSPPTALALAKQYGFSWGKYPLSWGDEGLQGDEPSIAAEGEVLVVYHTYCGGYGDGIPGYLKARGAKLEKEVSDTPPVSILFPYTSSKKLDTDLKAMFSQVSDEMREVEPFKTPWKTRWESYGRAAFFNDGKTVGMFFPIAPTDLPAFKQWVADRGIANASIRMCEYADEDKFYAIAHAKCSACNGALQFWSPRLQDIESEQLACTGCGGMYDMPAILKAEKKRQTALEKAEEKERQAAMAAIEEAKKPAKKAVAKKPAKKPAAKKAVAKKPTKKPAKNPAKKKSKR